MVRAKLTVRVGSYKRKGYKVRRGSKIVEVAPTTVRAHTKKISDVGLLGRTPAARKKIPPLDFGKLGIRFSESAAIHHHKLIEKAKGWGEKKVVGRLRAIQVLTKNTNPIVSRKALEDSKFIAGPFKGKKFVGEGKGW